MSTQTPERYVTTETAAEFISKHPSWIHNNAERLRMPYRKVGTQMRWKLSELDTWVQSQPSGLGAR